MLKYTIGKFLNLKLNTNASLLNEEKCHAILAGGVRTIVFSADAADEKLYSKLRVNGKLSKVLKNIEQFQKIRETQYQKSLIISRVSGVKFSKEQNFNSMKNFINIHHYKCFIVCFCSNIIITNINIIWQTITVTIIHKITKRRMYLVL